jgi:SAM-dependent methyltransferase
MMTKICDGLEPLYLSQTQGQESRGFDSHEEEWRMDECGGRAIEELKAVLDKLPSIGKSRALDVGSGSGRLTKDLLLDRFKSVDMFDPMPAAVAIAAKLKTENARVGFIYHTTMQRFNWRRSYDCVFMSWCSGYVDDEQLEEFLRRSKEMASFILLLENVADGRSKIEFG